MIIYGCFLYNTLWSLWLFFSRERVTHVGWSCERSAVARFCTYHAWMGVVMRWSCCISNKTVQNIMHVYCKKRAFFNDFDIVRGHWITHYSRKYAFSAGMLCLFQRMRFFCWFSFTKCSNMTYIQGSWCLQWILHCTVAHIAIQCTYMCINVYRYVCNVM